MGTQIRLDKYLAQAGTGTRTEVKKLIRSGRVSVNDETAGSGEQKIRPEADKILVDGIPAVPASSRTLMLHKPSGVVSATKDVREKTVTGLIHEPYAANLHPAGRLDKDTEGLLLLTDDGALSHALLSPKKHVWKIYFAVVNGIPDEKIVLKFREGLEIGEKRKTLPAKLRLFCPGEDTGPETGTLFPQEDAVPEDTGFCPENGWRKEYRRLLSEDLKRCGADECCALIGISEGKYHQIKRMFAACGREVHYLKRIAMGGVVLDPDLMPGQYRPLTDEEMDLLRQQGSGTGRKRCRTTGENN